MDGGFSPYGLQNHIAACAHTYTQNLTARCRHQCQITQVFLSIFIAAFSRYGLILPRDVGGGHKYLAGIGRGSGA